MQTLLKGDILLRREITVKTSNSCRFWSERCRIRARVPGIMIPSSVGETDLPDRTFPTPGLITQNRASFVFAYGCPYRKRIDHPNRTKQAGFPLEIWQISAKKQKRQDFSKIVPKICRNRPVGF